MATEDTSAREFVAFEVGFCSTPACALQRGLVRHAERQPENTFFNVKAPYFLQIICEDDKPESQVKRISRKDTEMPVSSNVLLLHTSRRFTRWHQNDAHCGVGKEEFERAHFWFHS